MNWSWITLDKGLQLKALIAQLNQKLSLLAGIVNDKQRRAVIDVRDFGATPGSANDVSSNLLKAAKAAAAESAEVLLIPPGDYNLASSRILFENATRLTVQGDGARLILQDGSNVRPFMLRGCTDFVVRGLTFKDEMTSGSHNAFDIQNSSRVWVIENRFLNHTFYGVSVTENSDTSEATACDDIYILYNYFEGIGQYGIEAFPKLTSHRQVIAHNTFKNCGTINTSAAAMKCGSQCYGAVCAHNTVYGGNIGLATGAHQTQLIESNQFVDCNQIGIAITPSDQLLEDPVTFPDRAFPLRQLMVVRNNSLTHSSGFSATGTQPAIMVNGGTDLAGTGLATGLGAIHIEDNKIDGWKGGGVHVRPTKSVPNVRIERNRIKDISGGVPIFADNGNGAYPNGLVVDDNYVENNDLTATTRNIIVSSPNAKITRNKLVRCGSVAIQVFGDGTEVSYNEIREPNPANTANKAAILVADTTVSAYKVHHNHVDNGTNGHAAAIIDSSNANPVIDAYANTSATNIPVKRVSTVTLSTTAGSFTQMGEKRVFYATAIPTSGAFVPGDEVINTAPVEGNPISWVCVTGGSPGVWRAANTVTGNVSVGDADVTLTAGTSSTTQRYATALTANRTVTLSTTGAWDGAAFCITRTGLGAFTLDVGGLKTIPASTAAFVDVEFDGTTWRLKRYGTL